MSNTISNLGGPSFTQPTAGRASSKAETKAASALGRMAETAEGGDVNALGQAALNQPDFDAEKVARIKQAIEQGLYPVDSRRIAENFMALESMIGGASSKAK